MSAPWNTSSGTYIIAEIGKNFIETEDEQAVEYSLDRAKRLVRAAKDAGANAVKFQTHTVEDEQLNIPVVAPHFKGADRYSWVSRNQASTPTQEFWIPLKQYCDEIGITFFSTPMSRGAAQELERVGAPFWKVGSGDILDFVLLDYLASTGKPILLSSGMSTLEELDQAISFLKDRNADIALLHCVSKYPCPPEELRLSTMDLLRERYGVTTGFSDHSIGIDSALAAVALGARIIEKHFSFSRELWGSDHKVSMTPEELSVMTAGIRRFEKKPEEAQEFLASPAVLPMLGTASKVLQDDEAIFRPYFRKSLMAGTSIPAGTVLTREMIYAMRPQQFAGGMPSEEYETVLGKRTTRELKKYDPITPDTIA